MIWVKNNFKFALQQASVTASKKEDISLRPDTSRRVGSGRILANREREREREEEPGFDRERYFRFY